MSKAITPKSIWFKGQDHSATLFQLTSIYDNMENTAKFYYELLDNTGNALADGDVTMDGQDYTNWGGESGSNINDWAYEWAAGKLNLELVNN